MTTYIVLGEGKSGTTALYTSVLENVANPVVRFFEPKDLRFILNNELEGSVVAKVLIEQVPHDQIDLLKAFVKRLFIVRDPRDSLVSRLLYRVRDMKFVYQGDKVARFLEAVREKEADPYAISVLGLYRVLEEVSGQTGLLESAVALHNRTVDLWHRLSDLYRLVYYEDFVAGATDDVSSYLGFAVSSNVEVEEAVRRVSRTRGSGDWRMWFNREDSDFAKEHFGNFMRVFGYTDWSQPAKRYINPAHGSDYVERIIRLKRSRRG